LTVFNGQRANIYVGTVHYLVTSLGTGGSGGSSGNTQTLVPVVTAVPDAMNFDVRPIVSADRRYVNLELMPQISSLSDVQIFPYESNVIVPGDTPVPIRVSTPLQLPVIDVTSVETTVSVPDKGTLMIGGLAFARSQDRESGPPILSKIPLLKWLFTMRGTQRVKHNLLILIRPQVLIREEMEQDI